MNRRKIRFIYTLVLLTLWPTAFFGAAKMGWVWQPLAEAGGDEQFMQAVVSELKRDAPPNAALALIQNGVLQDEFFVSQGQPIDRNTLFQVMSLSKWVTAWVVLTLIESQDLQLDTPVSEYLSVWKLPESEYDLDGVTVRRLLTHSAGVNSGDFEGFLPNQDMQSLVEFMTKPADGGAHGNVRIDQYEPGTKMRYSNNGFALLQHIVEQVTGEEFEDYAERKVLKPLQMATSTFDSEIAKTRSLTKFYDTNGRLSIHRRFGAVAPSSLYTSVTDLGKFVLAHVSGDTDELPGRGVLKPETVELLQRVQTPEGSDLRGLGVAIYGNTDAYTFGHDGVHFSDPSISTDARINPRSRNGIIVLVSGRRVLASKLAMEWDYWEMGRVQSMLIVFKSWKIVILGWFAIIIAMIALRRIRGTRS